MTPRARRGARRRRAPELDAAAWWTVAATIAALVLWTRQLAAPLFLDEGASWYLAYQPTWGGFWDLLRSQEVAPPPFYVGLRLVVHELGQDGHSAMRLPVVLATLPCVPLAAVLARQVRPDPRAGAWAAWLVALSPMVLEYAQQVRAYGPAMTATLLAAVLVARADRGGGPRAASGPREPDRDGAVDRGTGSDESGRDGAVDRAMESDEADRDGRLDRATRSDEARRTGWGVRDGWFAAAARRGGEVDRATRSVEARRTGWGVRDTWFAAVALGAGVWIHYVAAAPLAVLAAVAVWRAPARRRWVLAGVVGVSWLGAAAFARSQYDSVGAGVDEFVDLRWDDLRHVLAGAWDGRYAGWGGLVLVGVLALAGSVFATLRARGLHRTVLLAGLAGPAAVVALSAVGPDITLSRYAAPAVPLLVVGLAAAWAPSRAGRVALAVLAVCAAAGSVRSLDADTGRYPAAEAVVVSVLPTFTDAGGVVASSDLTTGLWLATYAAENSGAQNVRTALGAEALIAAVCDGRPIRQLVPANAAIPAQREWYRSLGYATRVAPTAAADTSVVVADPGPRTACPRPGPVPPVT